MRPHIEVSHASRSLDIPAMRCSRQVCWPTIVFCHRLNCAISLCASDCRRLAVPRSPKVQSDLPGLSGARPRRCSSDREVHQLWPSLARQKHSKRSQCVPLSVPSLLRSHRRSHRTTSLGITRTRQLPGQPGRPSECVRPTIVRPKVEGRASLTPSGKLEGERFTGNFSLPLDRPHGGFATLQSRTVDNLP